MFPVKWFLLVIGLVVALPANAVNDPTRPPFALKQTPSKHYDALRLSMILQEGNSRRAVINESVVGVSDSVAGAKVIKIGEDSVLLRRGGKQIKLTMSLEGVRGPLVEPKKDAGNE